MSIGRKIYDRSGLLMLCLAVWVILFGLCLKVYNAFVYPINYHGSLSNIWKAPLFSFKYFNDYWSNPTNIILYTFFLLPPLLGFFGIWYGFRVVDKEDTIKHENAVDEYIQDLDKKKKKPSNSKSKRKKIGKKKI